MEDPVAKSLRFSYDPRSEDDRTPRTITEMNLDRLRKVTNGEAGVLTFFPPEADPNHQNADCHDYNIAREEVVTAGETGVVQMEELPPTLKELAADHPSCAALFSAATVPLNQHNVQCLAAATRDQSRCDKWFEYRVGRITASNLYTATHKVKGSLQDYTISQDNTSFIKSVMNYGPSAFSPAIYWGQYNECGALKSFIKVIRQQHTKVELHSCGLYVYEHLPIIAASPDAMVTCRCHGTSPVEVKNPYKYRGLTICKLAEQEDSCLNMNRNTGRISLDPMHPYYTQIQAQMLATMSERGFFCVKTVSPYNNFHCEEISFDPMFMEDVVEKATLVFKKIIIPELLEGLVKKNMSKDSNNNVDTSDPTIIDIVACGGSDNTHTSATEYPCKVCKRECIEEPFADTDMSILCDKCDNWFHWVCVRINGKERFLKSETLKWYCVHCKA